METQRDRHTERDRHSGEDTLDLKNLGTRNLRPELPLLSAKRKSCGLLKESVLGCQHFSLP